MLAVELGNAQHLQRFYQRALQRGLAIDWFLFCNTAFRIAPPLTITEDESGEVCEVVRECL
jgi:4-aminobutyrate aminotransferase-like enzyme